jgi:hypothetical protein
MALTWHDNRLTTHDDAWPLLTLAPSLAPGDRQLTYAAAMAQARV